MKVSIPVVVHVQVNHLGSNFRFISSTYSGRQRRWFKIDDAIAELSAHKPAQCNYVRLLLKENNQTVLKDTPNSSGSAQDNSHTPNSGTPNSESASPEQLKPSAGSRSG